MKLYLRQKVFSFGDKFTVLDAYGNTAFTVEGEVFTIGKKLHVYDPSGEERLFIKQRPWKLLSTYELYEKGEKTAEVVKRFALRPKYDIHGPAWYVEGTFWEHDYNIIQNGFSVVSIHKRWMDWGDSYEIDIAESVDLLTALGVVLVIDCVMAAEAAAAAAST